MAKPIALAADHGGFELKEAVKAHLEELGLEYIDFGTHSTDSVDYPDMAVPACDAVVSGQCEKALLFCGTGVGISMAANKIKDIAQASFPWRITKRVGKYICPTSVIRWGQVPMEGYRSSRSSYRRSSASARMVPWAAFPETGTVIPLST